MTDPYILTLLAFGMCFSLPVWISLAIIKTKIRAIIRRFVIFNSICILGPVWGPPLLSLVIADDYFASLTRPVWLMMSLASILALTIIVIRYKVSTKVA